MLIAFVRCSALEVPITHISQFHIFIKGKELWGHIDGTDPAPNSEKEKEKYV